MNDKMVIAQEAANTELCVKTAKRNGHTAEEAENCDDGSVGCPDCPWQEVEMIVPTGPDSMLIKIVERIVGREGLVSEGPDNDVKFTLPLIDAKRAQRQLKTERNLDAYITSVREEHRLSPSQIRKLNWLLNKDFNPELPVVLTFHDDRAFVFCIPDEELEIPIKIAFKL